MKDYIEIRKKGIFYESTGDDAIIIWYFLGYKVNNKKIEFPERSLYKVLGILEEKKISYQVKDSKKQERKYDKALAYEKYRIDKSTEESLKKISVMNEEELKELLRSLK